MSYESHNEIIWNVKKFNELSASELYEILKLRSSVFVVEQNCIYEDIDDNDQKAFHLCGRYNGILIAYTRLFNKDQIYKDYLCIGRVCTSFTSRRMGFGRSLMETSINECYRIFGIYPIKISAQSYLKNFYGGLGFEKCGDEYLEDGIPHIPMIRTCS